MTRRRLLAAALWAFLAFLTWNVRFDIGVRQSATDYLVARRAYLQGKAPRVEMAPAMRAGVAESATAATLVATPFLLVAIALGASLVNHKGSGAQERSEG
jgi:hypothetical protein